LLSQKLFGLLGKVNQSMLGEFLEERKRADLMFSEALRAVQ